jgi:hypothetical protein
MKIAMGALSKIQGRCLGEEDDSTREAKVESDKVIKGNIEKGFCGTNEVKTTTVHPAFAAAIDSKCNNSIY